MAKLSFRIGDLEFFATTSNENHNTVAAILRNLPIRGRAQRWGCEIYFFVPFDIAPEVGRVECEPGEIGFWPSGPVIAIFWGKTPASVSDKPRAASDCNFFAKFLQPIDAGALESVEDGAEIVVSKAE